MPTLTSEPSRARPSDPSRQPPRPTSPRQLDDTIARVREGAHRFAKLSLEERVALVREMQEGYLKVAEEIVSAACQAKGIAPGSPTEGEEWGAGMFVVRHLRLLRESLEALRRTGNTPIGKVGRTADGRLTVGVFPSSAIDGMLFNGVRAEVHLQPGVTEEVLATSRARFYHAPDHDGRVVLVLGAGNLNMIVVMDFLTKMFNEGKACIVKMNPVNGYLGPFLERGFASAVTRGFLAITYGGPNEGEYLVHHPGVDEIHLTGSDKTFNAIVWGPPGPERDQRLALGTPLLAKPFTAELGNVSPAIVVPGPYSEAELAYQAEDIVSGMVYNAAFNCNAPRMIVTPKGWSRRTELLAAVERALAAAAPRQAYYPGAQDLYRRIVEGRSGISRVGVPNAPDALPWTLLAGLDARNKTESAFAGEAFCPILFEVEVGSPDPVEFLSQAVSFANDRLWGTLSAGLVVHPKLLKDRGVNQAVDGAIRSLRYGTVAINSWSGYSFAYGNPPWGGYPGATNRDIQSGIGWVHNTSMLEGVEKAVLRAPLVMKPKPATHPSHRTAHRLMRRMVALENQPGWGKVPSVVYEAMRG